MGQGPYADFMRHGRVLDALQAVARQHAARPALTGIDEADPEAPVRRWCYADLVADVRRAANLFHALSVGRPPRVALLLPPLPETHLALWGAETAGVACPINFQLNPGHIADLVQAFEADILVALGPAPDLDIDAKVEQLLLNGPRLRHVLRVRAGPGIALGPGQRDFAAELQAHDGDRLGFRVPEDDTAALFHTGGTTGAPKLARHTHANQLHAAWGAACMFGTRPSDVILNGFPLFHVAGSFVYGLSTLLAGGEVLLPTRTGLRNAAFMARFGDFVDRFGVTLLAAVPTVIAGLLALNLDRRQLHTVRALLTGGSPLPDELAAAFEAQHGIPVRNILGMTESAGVISIEPLAGPRTAGSCGLPLPFSTVAAFGSDGQALPVGHSGILRMRGPNVSPGYTDVSRNAGTFEQGWLISGDIGHVDEQGRVFVTGRAKDVIIRGAHNIDPGLIESVLLRHPSVLMAAAVGEPDAYAGELPVAFVSLKPGEHVTPEALLAFATPLIAERPAVPKRICIVDHVPVTAVGKVYKPLLRLQATRHAMAAQLAQQGLDGRVAVDVEDTAGGLVVRFTTSDPAAEAAVREVMKPFALAYTVRAGAAP
jgi:fatty-acyl-CoA synthase